MFKVQNHKRFFLVISILLLIATILGFTSIFLYKNGSLRYEIKKFQESYLTNYSQKKFINKVLKNVEIYNKDKMLIYISNNFDQFLTANEDLYTFIIKYAYLYHNSFDLLSELRSMKAISFNDYNKFKNHLNHLQFSELQKDIQYITLKNTNSNILAKKKYFEGIIAQLNFNYDVAQKLFMESLNYDMFDLKYYHALGNIYNLLYQYHNAIDTYEKGLNIANSAINKNKKLELKLLSNLAKTYNYTNNNYMALKTYSTLLVHAINLHNMDYEWLSIYNIADLEAQNGHYSLAINYLKYALKLSTRLKNNQYIAKTLSLLSETEYLYGDYSNGKKSALKAIKYAKKISDLNLLSESSLYACLNYEGLYEDTLAKIYCERSMNINNVVGQVLNRPEYYLQNANIYYFSDIYYNYDKALYNSNIAYNLSNKYNLLSYKILSLKNMTQMNSILGNFEDAMQNINEVIKLENYYAIKDDGFNNCLFGFLYLMRENYKQAILYYNKVMDYAVEKNDNSLLSVANTYLAIIYYNMTNYDDALKYSSAALNTNMKMYRFDNYNIEYQKAFNDMLIKIINNKR